MSDAQNHPAPPKVDLSKIPEPMRSMLLRQLEKMPSQLSEQVLREGSPLLDRVIAKARDREGAMVAPLPRVDASSISPDRIQTVRQSSGTSAPGRVQTVSPGDAGRGGTWLFVSAVVLAGAIWFAWHGG